MEQPTAAQRTLRQLAAQLAAANVDAAEALGAMLTAEAKRRKAVQGFGIEIRYNAITGRGEVRGPGK